MELKIKKDRVLKAAEKCPEAKEVLKEMFPEVLETGLVEKVTNQNCIGFLEKFIGTQLEYSYYTKIPGKYSGDKAFEVLKLLDKTWFNK